ncbi:MAG: glucosaminidase domain-containing protein [Bacteroidales bacterium]|nr:glucosaminidase domain-containing protein [Bacteroidales bacterium]
MQKIVCLTYLILLICLQGFSQNYTPQDYTEMYSEMAVNEMQRGGVPASIILGQGILESGNGNSRLAREANNHFGIKCHGWTGEKIYEDDDAKGECFRKYPSVADSYRDHTDFLKNNSRYHFLFDLDPTDYKAWAHGLKKAGYATSPTYAEALIRVIENNELYLYDDSEYKPQNQNNKKPRNNEQIVLTGNDDFEINPYGRNIYYTNNRPYIIVEQTDNLDALSEEMDMIKWQFRKYNDLDKNEEPKTGQKLYIKPKRNRAEKGVETHKVLPGETMYDISQKYGVKLKKLYRKNKMEEGTEPAVGTVLNLRKTIKK